MRLGILVPSGNPTIEPELYRMAPRSVTIHFARLESLAGEPGAADGMERRTLGYLDSVPAAIQSMDALRLGVVALSHTAVSYLGGFKAEAALLERIASLSGARPLTAATAISDALRRLGARRIALATPYPEVIASAGRAYWTAAGFAIVAHRGLEGVSNIYEETEERAYTLGRSADAPEADAVLISGTGLPTAGIVERLERELGKPVITSQTATLWRGLRLLGVNDGVRGYGRLLEGD
jgi:maleate isomerase